MFRRHTVVINAQPAPGKFRAMPSERISGEWAILDSRGATIDIIRVRAVAEYVAEELNASRAMIRPHACIGCRVELIV